MAENKHEFFRRDPGSGYGDGHHPIPAAGEDRYESIYRNPVGAQSGYELEGQREGTAVPLMRRDDKRGEWPQSKTPAAMDSKAKRAA